MYLIDTGARVPSGLLPPGGGPGFCQAAGTPEEGGACGHGGLVSWQHALLPGLRSS